MKPTHTPTTQGDPLCIVFLREEIERLKRAIAFKDGSLFAIVDACKMPGGAVLLGPEAVKVVKSALIYRGEEK